MKYKVNISVFLWLMSLSIFAQESRDSLNYIRQSAASRQMSTRMEKMLNTYNLNTFINFGQTIDRFSFNVNENFSSTIIKSIPQNIKDVHYFSLYSDYQFVNRLKLGLTINNSILSDDRRIDLNQASVTSTTLFSRYMPFNNIFIAPFAGYSNDRQIGENDYGYLYGMEGMINNLNLEDAVLYSSFKYMNDDISPRKNTIRFFRADLTSSLSENLQNQLSSSYSMNRKDFYFKAEPRVSNLFNIINNIQSRTETNYFLQDRLVSSRIAGNFSFDLTGRAAWRDIDRSTRYRYLDTVSISVFDIKIQEFRLEFESSASYYSDFFEGSIRANYSERDEKHMVKRIDETNIFLYEERERSFQERSGLEKQKNNKAIRESVSLQGKFNLTNRDFLFFSLFQNKLRYDTPSEDNFDDRDEILTIIRMNYLRNISPFFSAFINLEGSLNHIVYIFAERSSNNNYKRIIKLNTGGDYNGRYISSKNLFEVSANYTVYDFENLIPGYRSFSFRQMQMQDSSSIRLSRKIFVTFLGSVKISEQGEFNWGNFTGKPSREVDEFYAEPKVFYRFGNLLMGSGIRYFSVISYAYKSKEKLKESDYRSVGPSAEISLNMNNRLNLRLNGWYEFIRNENNVRRKLPNLTVQVDWML